MLDKDDIKEVLKRLSERYPDAECELVHSNPFELLINLLSHTRNLSRE